MWTEQGGGGGGGGGKGRIDEGGCGGYLFPPLLFTSLDVLHHFRDVGLYADGRQHYTVITAHGVSHAHTHLALVADLLQVVHAHHKGNPGRLDGPATQRMLGDNGSPSTDCSLIIHWACTVGITLKLHSLIPRLSHK